jgi:hypothetical protein
VLGQLVSAPGAGREMALDGGRLAGLDGVERVRSEQFL